MLDVTAFFENAECHANRVVRIRLPERVGDVTRAAFTEGLKRLVDLSLAPAEVVIH